MSRTPVHVVTGVDAVSMDTASMALAFELPAPVVLRHWIDPERQVLCRTISDFTGVLDHEVITLEHPCLPCALRESVVPTLEWLAQQGRWEAIIAMLPPTAEAVQLCRACHQRLMPPAFRIASVITALDGPALLDDLTDGELIVEREIATFDGDERGVAETLANIIEYADIVTVEGASDPIASSMLNRLRRPGSIRSMGTSKLTCAHLVPGPHTHAAAEGWFDSTQRLRSTGDPDEFAWTIDEYSERGFHPERFLDEMENLGSGPHRIRGCFWVPTRPDDACVIDGAAGQVAIGLHRPWQRREAHTRLTVTGPADAAGIAYRERVTEAFRRCLLTDEEWSVRGRIWEAREDGLEPWLGEISPGM